MRNPVCKLDPLRIFFRAIMRAVLAFSNGQSQAEGYLKIESGNFNTNWSKKKGSSFLTITASKPSSKSVAGLKLPILALKRQYPPGFIYFGDIRAN